MGFKTFLFLSAFCLLSPSVWAAEKSLMTDAFIVETSEDDIDDSLNRISGSIDRGFASEEYSYKAKHQGRSGPFETREEDGYSYNTSY